MKIAVIGAGIAGNVAAYHLCREHEVTMFEAGSHIGGHTHTHSVDIDNQRIAVDTGFIVFNDWTYPNFIALLNELGVEFQESSMSFSVKCASTGLEYNGTTLNSLFAQRSNLLRPSFLRMIRDILRFNREASALLNQDTDVSLAEYLAANRYRKEFINHYIVPMGAAIWSASTATMLQFPAKFFIRFFANHGMLSIDHRPTWQTIRGGSASYVEKLTAPFCDHIRLNTPVESVKRLNDQVWIKSRGSETERFDRVLFACHSDQALRLLTDATPIEREVLGAIKYQHNDVLLHTDVSVLPKRRLAWAAWNYSISADQSIDASTQPAAVTYNMNILQRLPIDTPLLVSLNMNDVVDSTKVIKRLSYEHPVFTSEAVAAQRRQGEINGGHHAYFCGAYWRNGFHEDGVVSALEALRHFEECERAQRHLHRTA